MKFPASETLAAGSSNINGLERAGHLELWQEAFGRPPPKHLSPRLMRRILIWDLQCRLLGGVPVKTDRVLKQIAAGKAPAGTTKPGSHLIREWNGRTYQVEVKGKGYVMDGKTYRSLSAIARRITGAHWSGPRFFGLT
ncbi:Protein of unknown function [Shimia gijangensis]|uniref:DUF2924 domain-containing protein n=1 Tax=Shimia gijangensis TaxID=1470563 RepID=A0A1M6Q6E0_9RHOB|nr:DUF2924 domain-containing protein [Shimia gijangensis]SHK15802.1 Protein of unknown function [Shimia gijangensis]